MFRIALAAILIAVIAAALWFLLFAPRDGLVEHAGSKTPRVHGDKEQVKGTVSRGEVRIPTKRAGASSAQYDAGFVVDGPLALYFDQLVDMVDEGNSDAAYLLYRSALTCKNTPSTQKELSERVDALLKSSNSNAGVESEVEVAKAQTLTDNFAFCEGISEERRGEYLDWLVKSAEMGNPYAQARYMSEYGAFLSGNPDIVRDPTLLEDYKYNAMRYLRSARDAGLVDALVSLGIAYENGIITDADLVEAYAHYHAYDLQDPGESAAETLQQLQEQLSASELERAIQRGQEIFLTCCN